MNNKTSTGIERGIGIIQSQLRSLSSKPGVYRMINSAGEVLYVGKANNLKKRVKTYTKPTKISHRITRMVSETYSMEIVTTHTEVEALLLESNLIKRLKPKYNVLLRDDKSFPYIFISNHESWPMLLKHRGSQSKKGDYFGPFASAGAVNRSINALQRAFMIRNCTDSVFKNRNRPCLQYQIKRCAAPCVNLISKEDYAELVKEAKEFLSGESISVQKTLAARMQGASDALEFETAAIYRNRIHALSQIQSHQDINIQGIKDADIFALHLEKGVSCVQVFFYRGGSNYGNRAYFPAHDKSHEPEEILAAFIGQFYDNKVPPKELIISHEMCETLLLTEALSTRFGRKVNILKPSRGPKKKLLKYALVNAREALDRKQAETSTNTKIFNRIAELFDLDATPKRIEVYDNSHIQGTNSVGAMIVAGLDGLEKNSYRKFNIRNIDEVGAKDRTPLGVPEASKEAESRIKPGDDYAMMRQVLYRRFSGSLAQSDGMRKPIMPDLVFIDGGPGQLSCALEVAEELELIDLTFVAISKGPDRNAGRERFYRQGKPSFTLKDNDPALYYLQRLRDEAHRFAIQTHRVRRSKSLLRSEIDDIPSVGAQRKRLLLHHFGSAKAISRAGLEDLEQVDGISIRLAKIIYEHFHETA